MTHQQPHFRHSRKGRVFPAGRGTARGRPTKKYQMQKDEDLDYWQLKKRHKIAPLADDDKDGVPNYRDCKPWDKKQQDAVNKFGAVRRPMLDNLSRDELFETAESMVYNVAAHMVVEGDYELLDEHFKNISDYQLKNMLGIPQDSDVNHKALVNMMKDALSFQEKRKIMMDSLSQKLKGYSDDDLKIWIDTWWDEG
jgi:hypothetical protein